MRAGPAGLGGGAEDEDEGRKDGGGRVEDEGGEREIGGGTEADEGAGEILNVAEMLVCVLVCAWRREKGELDLDVTGDFGLLTSRAYATATL